MQHDTETAGKADIERTIVRLLDGRPILLVGMMGAGKTTVGRRLAARLGLDFADSDTEIETAAGMSIPEIFARHGETEFRAGEARVVARLLREHGGVIATGGGVFMNPETRALARERAVSVWIKAEFELLFARLSRSRRNARPLLQTPDPRATLQALVEARYPTYALADLTVLSRDVPHDAVVDDLLEQLATHLQTVAANVS